MVVSYKEIIKKIEQIVEAHIALKGFYVGKNYEALEDERNKILFPLLQVQPLSATLNKMTDMKTYPTLSISLLLRCLDMVDKNELNKKQVYNDTLQYLQHIIDMITHHTWFKENDILVDGDFIVFISEEYTTNLNTVGWNTTISLRIVNWNGWCGLPFEDSPSFNSVVEKAYFNLINSLGGSIQSNIPLTANTLTNIIAPDSTVNVVYSDDQELIYSGTVASNTTETIEIDRPTCADANYTVNLDSVVYSAGTIAAGETQIVNVTSAAGYTPPVDWGWEAAAATIADTDDAFLGGYAILAGIDNEVAIKFIFAGTGTVDWGDGSAPEVCTNNVTILHTFNYAGVTSAVTSRGFKLPKIIFRSTGEFRGIQMMEHPNSQIYQAKPFIAIKIRSQFVTPFGYGFSNDDAQMLEILDLGNTNVQLSYMLYNHKGIKKLNFNLGTNISGALMSYLGGAVEVDWNSLDWSNFNNLNSMFAFSNRGEAYCLDISLPNCVSIASAFRQSGNFISIILRDTADIQTINAAIYNSPVLYFEMDDCSAVTDTVDFVYTAGIYQKLRGLILKGLTVGINLTNQKLTATALNNFFDGLGTANGAQTITITGCLGAGTCDTTIATNKGFTVVN